MAEEWVKDAQNKARLANNLWRKTSKVLGVTEQKNKELGTKLVAKERGRKSVEVGLRTLRIKLRGNAKSSTTPRQSQPRPVMDLKAKLKKAKEAAQATKAVLDTSKQKFYHLGVQETEVHLIEELAEVCRDYCQQMWTKALNLAGVPAASEWRRTENVYYPLDLQEAPTTLLGPKANAAPTTTALKQLPSIQASLPPPETSKRSGKANDQGQGMEVAKSKEAKALPEAKGPEAN